MALLLHYQSVMPIRLRTQGIPWTMRRNVAVVHRADFRLEARWMRVD